MRQRSAFLFAVSSLVVLLCPGATAPAIVNGPVGVCSPTGRDRVLWSGFFERETDAFGPSDSYTFRSSEMSARVTSHGIEVLGPDPWACNPMPGYSMRLGFSGRGDRAQIREGPAESTRITRMHGGVVTTATTVQTLTISNAWEGVEVVVRARGAFLEYVVNCERPAAMARAYVSVDGAQAMHVRPDGVLLFDLGASTLTQSAPVVVDSSNGSPLKCRYARTEVNAFSFAFGDSSAISPLSVDPVLSFAAASGGHGYTVARATAIDADGEVLIAGTTRSRPFVSVGHRSRGATRGDYDAYVCKVDVRASKLRFATFLGGRRRDVAAGVAVGGDGSVWLAGTTFSRDFPTHNEILGPDPAALPDAFVTKLSADGSRLLYSTYLGGFGPDEGTGVALDSAGNCLVTGATLTSGFPTETHTAASPLGGTDAFVCKLDGLTGQLRWTRIVGGSSDDVATAVASASLGEVLVAGSTKSLDFSGGGVVAGMPRGGTDAFLSVLSEDGFVLATRFVGGSGDETATGVAPAPGSGAYLVGKTGSSDFLAGAANQIGSGGNADAFVVSITAIGDLQFASRFGGSGDDAAVNMAATSNGHIYVCGATSSSDFPVVGAVQQQFGGIRDSFIVMFDEQGTVVYSTYLGGMGSDEALGVATRGDGRAVIVGGTASRDFPIVSSRSFRRTGVVPPNTDFMAVIDDCGDPEALRLRLLSGEYSHRRARVQGIWTQNGDPLLESFKLPRDPVRVTLRGPARALELSIGAGDSNWNHRRDGRFGFRTVQPDGSTWRVVLDLCSRRFTVLASGLPEGPLLGDPATFQLVLGTARGTYSARWKCGARGKRCTFRE